MGGGDASHSTALLYVGDSLQRQVTTCRTHNSLNPQFGTQYRSPEHSKQGRVKVTVPVILDWMMAASSA